MKMKPTAVEITSWHPYKQVLYKCTNCGQDFRFFGTREKYCHNCGIKVNWKHIVTELSEPFDKNDYEKEKKFIKILNKMQLSDK